MGLKQVGSFRFRFGGVFAHAPVLTGECSDPISIISTIRKQQRPRFSVGQQCEYKTCRALRR
jgi:hypothetical protein